MSKPVFLVFCFWALLVLPRFVQAGTHSAASELGPPNVVLIMADDLGWKDLNCYGNKKLDTPHLDRLAREGLRFSDAYSAAPVCTPTRAALMTGEAPARLHITNHASGHPLNFRKPGTELITPNWLRHLPLQKVTLAEQLKSVGYATAFIGKWHLSHVSKRQRKQANEPTEEGLRPEHQGFDMNLGGCQFGGPPSYFAPYRLPNLQGNSDGEYLPERCADECVRFIESHLQSNQEGNANRPFFLCWWNYSVHYPFQAPEELIAKYRTRKGPGVENPTYAAMIEGMDLSIGKLLNYLREAKLEKNTLVIFTSDNGPFAANVKPLREEKGHLYEGGIRVPLMIRWPAQIQPGRETDTPAITMDLHATILDAASLKHDVSNTPDGISLLPIFQGREMPKRPLYFHYPNYAFHKKNRMGSAIRKGNYKLIQFYDDASLELYDLKSDIGESHNLVAQKPDVTRQLHAELKKWLLRTKAQQPQKKPNDDLK